MKSHRMILRIWRMHWHADAQYHFLWKKFVEIMFLINVKNVYSFHIQVLFLLYPFFFGVEDMKKSSLDGH